MPTASEWFRFAKHAAEAGGDPHIPIELYLVGLGIEPDALEGHQGLREAALRRTANGGRPLGIFDRLRLPKARDDRQAMLNAERLWAYDPGNSDHLERVLAHARRAGLNMTAAWASELASKMGGYRA